MPNTFSDVNFIPDEVISTRKHESQVKSLNKFAIAAMVITLIIGIGLWGYNYFINRKATDLENQIVVEQEEIDKLSEFAEQGYQLGQRLDAISAILNKKPHYSKVLDQLYKEVPEGISVLNVQVNNNGSVILSGTSYPNYIPIATFQDNLNTSESDYFSDVRLKSASLNKSAGDVNFTIDFVINLEKIYESI